MVTTITQIDVNDITVAVVAKTHSICKPPVKVFVLNRPRNLLMSNALEGQRLGLVMVFSPDGIIMLSRNNVSNLYTRDVMVTKTTLQQSIHVKKGACRKGQIGGSVFMDNLRLFGAPLSLCSVEIQIHPSES